jgi:hypothetical protein
LTPRRQCRDQADHLGMRGRGRIAQLRYAVSFGQPIQFDERPGELQLRRAPRKEDLEQLAMTEQRVKFRYCGVK